MTRWVWLLAAALSLSVGCGWEWDRSCEGILTTELECAMVCATDPTLDYTWTPFNDSTQCGTCECTTPGGGGTTTP